MAPYPDARTHWEHLCFHKLASRKELQKAVGEQLVLTCRRQNTHCEEIADISHEED